MKRYRGLFIGVMLVAVWLIVSYVDCSSSPPPVTSELQTLTPSPVYFIEPEGVDTEEWYDYLDLELGLGSGGEVERVKPGFCIFVYEINLPEKVFAGQTINITIKATPNASLDLEFKYPIQGGIERTERVEYVNVGADGTVTISWLVSKDIVCEYVMGSVAFVSLDIEAYPQYRACYSENGCLSLKWREMPVAVMWGTVFTVSAQ